MMPERLVIGVGNAFRSDDMVGLVVADRLRAIVADATVQTASGEGVDLMQMWDGAAQVWLIDAVSSGAAAGTIHRLEAASQPIPARFFHYTTHAFGVAEAIEMARALGTLPPAVVVYGIEGQEYGFGTELSSPVAATVDEVVTRIQAELASAPAP